MTILSELLLNPIIIFISIFILSISIGFTFLYLYSTNDKTEIIELKNTYLQFIYLGIVLSGLIGVALQMDKLSHVVPIASNLIKNSFKDIRQMI